MSKIFYISTLLFVVTFMVYEGKKDFLPVWEETSIIWCCEIYSTYTFLTLSKCKHYFVVDFFLLLYLFSWRVMKSFWRCSVCWIRWFIAVIISTQ